MKNKLILALMALAFVAPMSFAGVHVGVIAGPRYVPAPVVVAPAPVYVAPPPIVTVPRPVFIGPAPYWRGVWAPGRWMYGPRGRYWVGGYRMRGYR
jgi:hypothetical protein